MKYIYENIPAAVVANIDGLPGNIVNVQSDNEEVFAAAGAALKKKSKIAIIPKEYFDENGVALIASVRQTIKSDGSIPDRIIMELEDRAEYCCPVKANGYYTVNLSEYVISGDEISISQEKAYVESFIDAVSVYSSYNPGIRDIYEHSCSKAKSFEEFIDISATTVPYEPDIFIKVLCEHDLKKRFDIILEALIELTEKEKYKKTIHDKVVRKLDDDQREYYLREQINTIREELGDDDPDSETDIYLEKCSELEADESIKEKITTEIKKWKRINQMSPENAVLRDYIETLLALPWGKIQPENNDLKHAIDVLENNHYGMKDIKDRVIESIAVRQLAPKGTTPIICLVGPPGTGKTSVAASIAEALERKYVRMSLGGVRDEAEIRGHRRTYVGAMPGKIINALKNAGVANPLILLDEIDKVSNDFRGDTFSALLEVLDPEQNRFFTDHYIDMPVDLSEVFFICTANTTQSIPDPLVDRMEIIEVSSYTQNEKFHIAEKYLVSKQMKTCGLRKSVFRIDDEAILRIIFEYTREAGVRQLERLINELCRKAAKLIVSGERKTVRVTAGNLEKYLGKPVYTKENGNNIDEVGIVNGLAWTSVGGVMLEIEVGVMDGKGGIELTGMMGDVMKESAKTAVSYVRSCLKSNYDEYDIHIHIPEGAVPKDGPSAGVTMAAAIYSAVSGIAVRSDHAMTGEITLRGRVLPVGGLKEKVLAAKNAEIMNVIVPAKNKKDIDEIPDEIKEGMSIIYVQNMKEILDRVLIREDNKTREDQ